MKEVTLKIYEYEELNDIAKAKARELYGVQEYVWSEDALYSLKAFFRFFEATINDYQIDWLTPGCSMVRFEAPDLDHNRALERYNELVKEEKNLPDCFGWSLADGFKEGLNQSEDLKGCLGLAVEGFLNSCMKDYEYQLSEEHFKEDAENNEWLFFEDGRLYEKT